MERVQIQNHQIVIKNLRIYYRTAGDPKNPPVVLLNGWGARLTRVLPWLNNLNSERIIQELAGHNFYVVSPEHPGLMRSESPKTVWGPTEYAEYVEEFCEKVGLQSFILIGQSFGGAIATLYTATHPKRVKILVLVSAGLANDKKSNLAFKRRYLYWILRTTFMPKFIKKMWMDLFLGIPWDHVEKESYERRGIMWDIHAKWLLPNVYAQIQTPTILIWGKYDLFFPLFSAREVLKELPNAKLYSVLGGHSILYTQPKRMVKLIRDSLFGSAGS